MKKYKFIKKFQGYEIGDELTLDETGEYYETKIKGDAFNKKTVEDNIEWFEKIK